MNDNTCDRTAEEIRKEGKYAIGLGDSPGTLALSEGFLSADYLILHKLTAPIVFKLRNEAKLIKRERLGNIPHKMIGAPLYILYEVDHEEPELARRIDRYRLIAPPDDYDKRQSYVTDINKMMWMG